MATTTENKTNAVENETIPTFKPHYIFCSVTGDIAKGNKLLEIVDYLEGVYGDIEMQQNSIDHYDVFQRQRVHDNNDQQYNDEWAMVGVISYRFTPNDGVW